MQAFALVTITICSIACQATEHSTAHIATVSRQRGPDSVVGGFNVSAALQALSAYTTIIRNYSDLALSQYAHVGRALMLYELGQWPESISELKSVEFRLRGYAEVRPCTFDACAAAVQAPYTSRPLKIGQPATHRSQRPEQTASEL